MTEQILPIEYEEIAAAAKGDMEKLAKLIMAIDLLRQQKEGLLRSDINVKDLEAAVTTAGFSLKRVYVRGTD